MLKYWRILTRLKTGINNAIPCLNIDELYVIRLKNRLNAITTQNIYEL